MLEQITPLIITYNEAPNISRTLEKLYWAKDIVIVDSFSTDETLMIIEKFPRVRVFQRIFDQPANQFNFGLEETNIGTEWVLALGADNILTDNLIKEFELLRPSADVMGYFCHFIYCIFGKNLRACVYPPRGVLFRRSEGEFIQDGHTEQLKIAGKVLDLKFPIMHDDRKSFSRWLASQEGYAQLETEKLSSLKLSNLNWPDRVRKFRIVAPFAVFFYCLFVKGLILDGWPGIYYSFQRMLAELILSLHLIEYDFVNQNIFSKKTKTSGKTTHL